MGIYIKHMTMPANAVLFCIHPDGKVFADLEGKWREYKAVPVPAHRRLGDLGKLAEYFDNLEKEHPFLRFTPSAVGSILRSECCSPTIIEAEEGER